MNVVWDLIISALDNHSLKNEHALMSFLDGL